MACEVGLYYVLHITKQRNKNALLRLLPGLGECARDGTPPSSPDALCPHHSPRSPRAGTISPNGRGAWSFPSRQTRAGAPHQGGREASSPGNLALHARGTLQARKTGHPGALQEPAAG